MKLFLFPKQNSGKKTLSIFFLSAGEKFFAGTDTNID
jgi:hypothetical protein